MELSYAGLCFDLFGTLVGDGGAAIAGAREALAALDGGRWAIVTSAPRAAATALILRAGLAVPLVLVSADDVPRNKPAADPFALAVRRLALEPAQALAIEDSVSGVESAQAAGMEALFIGRGRPASACARADFFVDRFAQLRFTRGANGEIRVGY